MSTSLDKLTQKFDLQPVRMRLMLTFIVIVFIYLVFELFWFASNQQQIEKINKQIEVKQKEIEQFVIVQQQYNQSIFLKRNDPKNIKLAKLNQQLLKIRKELTDKTLNLIPPEEMAQVIKIIIDSSQSLKLEYLAKQQTVALAEQDNPSKKRAAKRKVSKENPVQLFRHSMKIILKGDYRSTYLFLKKLEQMEKKVAFDSFEYQVKTYPKAEIHLIVSTLSLQKGWIGG
ncbi:MAG: hypothetical protein Q9M92_07295 [Enterobacterales bacterium]|nr:hypothetical protein [Enterobacterales bacterium]